MASSLSFPITNQELHAEGLRSRRKNTFHLQEVANGASPSQPPSDQQVVANGALPSQPPSDQQAVANAASPSRQEQVTNVAPPSHQEEVTNVASHLPEDSPILGDQDKPSPETPSLGCSKSANPTVALRLWSSPSSSMPPFADAFRTSVGLPGSSNTTITFTTCEQAEDLGKGPYYLGEATIDGRFPVMTLPANHSLDPNVNFSPEEEKRLSANFVLYEYNTK
ncbi:unnamed protein product [Sympodiomycopsis kandeliae]